MIIYNKGLRIYRGIDGKARTKLPPGSHIEVSDRIGKALTSRYPDLVDFNTTGVSSVKSGEIAKREKELAEREAALAAREAVLVAKENEVGGKDRAEQEEETKK